MVERPLSKVKRPSSSFILFHTDMAPQIKRDNPTFNICDIAKKIGSIWKTETSESVKKQYSDRANADKERYEREVAQETKANNGVKLLTLAQRKEMIASNAHSASKLPPSHAPQKTAK